MRQTAYTRSTKGWSISDDKTIAALRVESQMDSDEVIRNANSLATYPCWRGEKHAFAFLRFDSHLLLVSAMRRILPSGYFLRQFGVFETGREKRS